MKIAIYGRAFITDFVEHIRMLFDLLRERNVDIFIYEPFAAFLQQTYAIDLSGITLFDDIPPAETDCLLSIGGDGTFLRSLKIVRNSGIPVMGINGGRLGFLSTAELGSLQTVMDAFLQQQYDIEERALLEVQSDILPHNVFPYALNEVGIQRNSPAMVGVSVQLNGVCLPTYWADGLLIATPTGSTAYSMSVGGPIVMPNVKNFIISPIAPHNLNTRSLVISDDSILVFTVESRCGSALLTIDNHLFEIPSCSTIIMRKASFTFRTVRLRNTTFFDTLSEKLSWGKDNRNQC